MAKFEEHCRDCERLLGNRCEEVNHWLDEYFHRFGPLHRFMRHHWTGVEEAGEKFGPLARRAAIIHILKDCGRVPTDQDWKEERVDSLGIDPKSVFAGYWDPYQFDLKAKELLERE